MCTTGTKGLRGRSTRETPGAKNGLPAISAGGGGGVPSFVGGVGGADAELRVFVALFRCRCRCRRRCRRLVDHGRVLVPPHRREVAAALLEHLPAQLAHLPAAAALAPPGLALEPAAVQLLEPGADPVPQAPEELLG